MVGQVELNPYSNLVSSPFLQNNTKNYRDSSHSDVSVIQKMVGNFN